MATTVVIADDHHLVRQSVTKAVAAAEGFEVVGQAGDGEEALRLIQRTRPDLLLVDIAMPKLDGLSLAEAVRENMPDVRIIFLSMHDDDASLRRAVSLGAEGFVTKEASIEELIESLRTVRDGGSFLSSTVAGRVMKLAAGGGSGPGATLTEREREVLELLARGLRPAGIAEELVVSVKTVKNHLTSVYSKLQVDTAAQAVAVAYQQGLVSNRDPDD